MVSEKIVQHDIMSQPPRRNRGRPPGKRGHKKNIAGLRNQPAAPSPVEERIVATHPFDSDEDPDDDNFGCEINLLLDFEVDGLEGVCIERF